MPDNIYVNVSIQNNTNNQLQIAKYESDKASQIIDNPSDYYCAVTRFEIPLATLPLLIMPIDMTQPILSRDPNLSIYKIGITYLGVDYPVQLVYIPGDNINLTPVPKQDQEVQVITNYYYVYNTNVIVLMFNNALYQAWVNAGNPGTNCPFFKWNTETEKFSIIYSNNFINSGASIFFNAPCIQFFDGFNIIGNNLNSTNGHVFDLVLKNIYPNNPNPPPPINITTSLNPLYNNSFNYIKNVLPTVTPDFYEEEQSLSSVSSWLSMDRILITSNGIPIAKEILPSINSINQQTYQIVGFPVLSDFIPSINTLQSTRETAYYYSNLYRLHDMTSNVPLRKIDIQVYWSTKQGNILPLYLFPGSHIEVKLGFFHKSLYKKND